MTAAPLIQSLVERHGYPVLGERDVPAFGAAHETAVLFFAGDPARVLESADVAVILPELLARFRPRLTAALVDPASEMHLQAAYHFVALPALVFLRRGRYLGMIARVRPWDDYVRETEAILNREPAEPPPFDLPEGCAGGGLV